MSCVDKGFSPYISLLISGLTVVLDQVIKWQTQQSIAYGDSISLTPFFNWVHTWNTGAAFGLLSNGGGWQRYFFIGVALLMSVALTRLIFNKVSKRDGISYGLILGGAVGNLIDRLFRGYVVDSFHLGWQTWQLPVFNIADIAITLGVILLLLSNLQVSMIPNLPGSK